MKKVLLLASVVLSIAISCSTSPTQILVDNPTEDTISVTIGKDTIIINAKQFKFHDFPEGEYQVKYADTTFKLTVGDKSFILNPTKSAYILEQAVYSKYPDLSGLRSKLHSPYDRIPYDTIQLLGLFDISGNLKRISDVIINEEFDYGLNQEFPQSIELKYANEEKQLVKISRENDFLAAKMKELQSEEKDSIE
jgi:hypothetical protein